MDEKSSIEGRPERAHPVFRHLGAGLSEVEIRLVEGWWERLSMRERGHLSTLYDARMDSCAFSRTPRRDGSSGWHRLAIEVQGRFVDEERDGDEEAFPLDFYEYLVNHEMILTDGRTYHICTQHEAAEAVVRAAKIPATFSCPLDRSSCPMRRLLALAPGRSLHLDVHPVFGVPAADRP